jgi:acyl carrier protein
MTRQTRDFFIHVLRDKMNLDIDDAALADDTPLGSSGIELDSMSIIELAQHAEQQLGVTIPDEDLTTVARFTVGDLLDYLDTRIQDKAAT